MNTGQYRVIKKTNNLTGGVKFVIERRGRWLFFFDRWYDSWFDGETGGMYGEYDTPEEAIKMCKIYTGELKESETEIIYESKPLL